MRWILVILAAVSLFACGKESISLKEPAVRFPGFSEFFIPAGAHYAQPNAYRPFSGPEIRFEGIFDSSAIYRNVAAGNQADINKLFGVSDGNDHHQVNSARFGWNWNGKQVEIYAYCYVNRVRTWKLLGTATIGQRCTYQLKAAGHHYEFDFNGHMIQMDRGVSDSLLTGYTLYPYFGGDEPAPHDIRIYLKGLP